MDETLGSRHSTRALRPLAPSERIRAATVAPHTPSFHSQAGLCKGGVAVVLAVEREEVLEAAGDVLDGAAARGGHLEAV
ncbi:unnamed protein product [Closterium sp. NIES-54]